ncbi:MAG: MBL fold metallo-hydrolase [Thermoplasmatales archaeon]|nr:MBL fold metallo-hydrolase [Thermoplasmatales archaeon]
MEVKRYLGFGFESNVYLIKTEKIAIIDTGTGFYSKNLINQLEKEINMEEIDYIILTHEHFDHCGGAKELKELSNSKIVAHKNSSYIIEEGLDISASFFNAIQPKVEIDLKVRGGEEIDLGDIKLKILHTPGHSKGSISIYEEDSKSLFSGDTVFAYGNVGRTDFFGGDFEELRSSIKILSSLEVKNLYPGHGEYILNSGGKHVAMAEKMLDKF